MRRSVHGVVENKAPNHLLSEVLDAVEDASPLEAVESVTQTLARALGASAAFFLVADVAGGALVRMSHGASDETLGWQGLGGPWQKTSPLGGRRCHEHRQAHAF